VRICHVLVPPPHVEARAAGHVLEHGSVVEVPPLLVPRGQQPVVHGLEPSLPAGRLGRPERVPPGDALGVRRLPHVGIAVGAVHLAQRKVSPLDPHVLLRRPHPPQEQRRLVDVRAEIVEVDLELHAAKA
jgi:hypothetical protein